MKLLRGGARDLPVRHQTLRDTIDWSYEALDAREQRLFALLSVFSIPLFISWSPFVDVASCRRDGGRSEVVAWS